MQAARRQRHQSNKDRANGAQGHQRHVHATRKTLETKTLDAGRALQSFSPPLKSTGARKTLDTGTSNVLSNVLNADQARRHNGDHRWTSDRHGLPAAGLTSGAQPEPRRMRGKLGSPFSTGRIDVVTSNDE
jgi:hypothetical protein